MVQHELAASVGTVGARLEVLDYCAKTTGALPCIVRRKPTMGKPIN